MASAWGSSWGSSWGDSWGAVAVAESTADLDVTEAPDTLVSKARGGRSGRGRLAFPNVRFLEPIEAEFAVTERPDSLVATVKPVPFGVVAATERPDTLRTDIRLHWDDDDIVVLLLAA